MNKKIYLLPLLLLVALFTTSCEETKEAGKYDNWQPRNQAFLDSLQNVYDTKPDHGGLKYFVPFTDVNMRIYYKVTTENTSGARPVIPDVVSVFYRGTYYTGEKFDQNFTEENPSPFDKPNNFWVNPISMTNPPVAIPITGWIETLQQMRVGERWTVYLPWQMAYGEAGAKSIPGYSVLIFDMQLLDILEDYFK
ncbi:MULTISPECIES: FKBP-type peptidyl-prolyl cis-trans isomerase [Bacteroides]|uniref:FKBP-type peptidyl-prolyl cis-trans isomerase n=1 Tax=Bacteroides TaxID=816 RepID=UPI0004B27CBA|nr:FKBP-type peptidyl-prolyl cis-trans isomerase [Bacteroides neonati]